MPFNLIGVPADAEVWLVGNTHWLIWYVPNSDPPVPMAWRVPSSLDRTALGITGHDRTLNTAQFNQTGALNMGTSTEIPDAGPGVHPFDALLSIYETEIKVKPWLADPEILALWAGAAIEGRSVSPAELQGSEWWRTHSALERQWISLNASDPASAANLIADNKLNVTNILQAAGIDNASGEFIEFLSNKWTTGQWTEAKTLTQIQGLSDPSARVTLDPELDAFRQGLDITQGREEEVRTLVNRWLGPAYAAGWEGDPITQWAGNLRNNPDAETELLEILRNQRLALFPEYDNPNLTYDDIAAPWRGVFNQVWGQVPDETDALFSRIVRLNDLDAATAILREEGIKSGNATVVRSLLSDVGSAFGGQVRPAEVR